MGNVSTVVLTTPFRDHSPDKSVEAGLANLGFKPADDSREVWLLDGQKLNYHAEGKFGIDGLRDLVLALPWGRRSAPTHLQVLWSDDYTTQDDSWCGREAPYSWNHETWAVPR